MATGALALENSRPELQTDTLPREEKIRQRAYQIYLQRGGQAGSDTDDWLQAEDEVRREDENE